jgi:hypothetical protein
MVSQSVLVEQRVHAGDYLTDGHRLVRVLDVTSEWVMTEDALEMVLSDENELVYRCEQVPTNIMRRWRKVRPG